MTRNDLRNLLNWDACKACGECLVRCRYIDISRDEAVIEIGKIHQGRPSFVIKKCISCYACNAFCPNDAHPYERLVFAWELRYREKGLPRRATYLLPGCRPNFREDIKYSVTEKALVASWGADQPPAETVLYPGCNLLSMPLLATGRIFEHLPVWGRWDLCCGEMYFRTGLFSKARETAEKLSGFYRNKDIREMVFVCPAGYNMFTNVMPRTFGVRFDFKTTFFTDWLQGELDRGTFEIRQAIHRSAVIHDACHARILGDAFMEKQRQLLQRIGITVYETPLHKSDGLCCGMAAGANRFNVVDLVKNSLRQLAILDRAPGTDTAIYCTGCLLMMSCVRPLRPFGKRLVHFLEYIRQAMGETVPRKNLSRALSMSRGIATHVLPHHFRKERFYFPHE